MQILIRAIISSVLEENVKYRSLFNNCCYFVDQPQATSVLILLNTLK